MSDELKTTLTTAQIYECLNPDDPIVNAVLAERERCAAIARRFRLDEHADIIMLQEIDTGR
jgi:hypothetical protein